MGAWMFLWRPSADAHAPGWEARFDGASLRRVYLQKEGSPLAGLVKRERHTAESG